MLARQRARCLTRGVRADESERAPSTTRAAWLRFAVAFLLVELVVAQVWPALHHAFFAHAICPEHGEVIHVSALQRAASGPAQEAEKRVVADPERENAHEHCQVPPGTRDPASAPALATGAAEARLESESVPVASAAHATPPIPLLALAPKLPPPC